MNEETKKVFSPRPMVSFRSPRKIRAKLYPLDSSRINEMW